MQTEVYYTVFTLSEKKRLIDLQKYLRKYDLENQIHDMNKSNNNNNNNDNNDNNNNNNNNNNTI